MIDTSLIIDSLPALTRGMGVTLEIAFISCIIGLTLGMLFGILQGAAHKVIRFLIGAYVTIIRGTPILIQIFFIAFGLPQFGIQLPAFWAAIIAIGLNSSAYISQIIRSGIASVSKGQIEAARALGLSNIQITRYIVLPQAIRVVLPALGNELIMLVKESSLASIIGVVELTKEGRNIINITYDALTMYCAVGLFYLLITSILSYGITQLEKRMNYNVKN